MRITSAQDKLNILLIEDSRGDALLLKKALANAMPGSHVVEHVTNLDDALKILADKEFDIALLDRSLPDVEGFAGMQSIQNMAPALPVVFLTAYQDEEVAFDAIEQGAQDYLYKDKIEGHMLKRAIQYAVLRKSFEGVLIMRSNIDTLTGLADHTLFESKLDMAIARMNKQDTHLAVLFLDLGHFKQVNDVFGYMAGDTLLKEVGVRLKKLLRPYDTVARFGDDEFAVLLEGLYSTQHCETVAQKIITLFNMPFIISGKEFPIGVSIGISTCTHGQNSGSATLMQEADEALRVAKTMPQSAHYWYGAMDSVAKKATQ